jgi:hypothetical protein
MDGKKTMTALFSAELWHFFEPFSNGFTKSTQRYGRHGGATVQRVLPIIMDCLYCQPIK